LWIDFVLFFCKTWSNIKIFSRLAPLHVFWGHIIYVVIRAHRPILIKVTATSRYSSTDQSSLSLSACLSSAAQASSACHSSAHTGAAAPAQAMAILYNNGHTVQHCTIPPDHSNHSSTYIMLQRQYSLDLPACPS
jgi:hypothetical protein